MLKRWFKRFTANNRHDSTETDFTSSLASLPDHVLRQVLGHLNTDSKVRLASTCSKLRHKLFQEACAITTICKGDYNELLLTSHSSNGQDIFFGNGAPAPRHLRKAAGKQIYGFFKFLNNVSHSLKTLYIPLNLVYLSRPDCLTSCILPSLRRLRVEFAGFEKLWFLSCMGKAAPCIYSLSVECVGYDIPANADIFRIWGGWDTYPLISNLHGLEQLTNLTILNFAFHSDIYTGLTDYVVSNPSLKALDLRGCDVSGNCFVHLLDTPVIQQNLKELRFSFNYLDETAVSKLHLCQALQFLNAGHVVGYYTECCTPELFEQVGMLASLSHLHIDYYCPEMNIPLLQKALQESSNLKYVSLRVPAFAAGIINAISQSRNALEVVVIKEQPKVKCNPPISRNNVAEEIWTNFRDLRYPSYAVQFSDTSGFAQWFDSKGYCRSYTAEDQNQFHDLINEMVDSNKSLACCVTNLRDPKMPPRWTPQMVL